MAALTSPFWLATKAWSASRPSLSIAAIEALDTIAFSPSSQTIDGLADQLPVRRVLEGRLFRLRELGGGFRHLAVGGFAARRLVRDHAVARAALGGRHVPRVGGGLDQHDPRGGAALADVLVRVADAAAAARGEVTPRALALHALAGRRILGLHLRPVALELLGDHLREARERPLPHLGARDPDHDRVVRADDHPGVHFGRAVLGAHDARAERDLEAESEPGAGGGAADDERATIELRSPGDHGAAPLCLRRCVDGLTHLLEGSTPTDVGDPRVDIGVGRLRLLLQEGRHRHDHARLAVAALRDLVVEPGLLHLVQGPAVGQAFDGGDLLALGGDNGQHAGTDRGAVEVHGTGAALRDTAAVLGAGETHLLTDRP